MGRKFQGKPDKLWYNSLIIEIQIQNFQSLAMHFSPGINCSEIQTKGLS